MTTAELAPAEPIRTAPCTALPARRGMGAAGVAMIGVLLVAWAIWLRCTGIGHLPGINGDEAWSGVQAAMLARGEAASWTTPSGNVLNIFYVGPLAALHALFPPSFTLLRCVALASGVAALALNWALCRKAFDPTTAAVSTLALAVLPVNLAYSRFGWDASQTLLATLPVVYLPIMALKRPIKFNQTMLLATAAYVLAIVVHPTNLFVGSMLLVPLAYHERTKLPKVQRKTRWACVTVISAAALAWLVVSGRVEELAEFVAGVGQLLSGRTIYEYICGPNEISAAGVRGLLVTGADIITWLVAGAALVALTLSSDRSQNIGERLIGVALGTSLVSFFAVAGAGALKPGFERYGIWMVAPIVILVSRGLSVWLDRARTCRLAAATALCVLGASYLGAFQWNYVAWLNKTGGGGHRTFRTASVEPKLQAFKYALTQRDARRPLTIVADDWWLYWPLRYLALGEQNVQVYLAADRAAPTFSRPADAERVLAVAFAQQTGGRLQKLIREGSLVLQKSIKDASGQELIWIAVPRRKNFGAEPALRFDKGAR